MPIEFQIPSLRIQVRERLSEGQSEQIWLQQLLELGETWARSVAIVEHEQQWRKVFVDQHRGAREKHFKIGKVVLAFQTCMGQMPRKLRFR